MLSEGTYTWSDQSPQRMFRVFVACNGLLDVLIGERGIGWGTRVYRGEERRERECAGPATPNGR